MARACRQRIPGVAAALVAGGLPALAFPAPSWWWLAWFGVVPLLLVVRAAPTPWAASVRAAVGLSGFVLTNQYWLATSIGPMLVLLAIGLGALWVPWGWFAHRLLSAPVTIGRTVAAMVVLPSAWVAAEAVRSCWLGGPWASLGASQWNQPVTLASAALGGVWLTSFLLIATNTAIAGVIVHRAVSGRLVALAGALACAALGPGWYLLGPARSPVQRCEWRWCSPAISPTPVPGWRPVETLTAAVAGQRPDLVVWGESSVGQDLGSHPELLARLAELSRRVGAALLVNVDAPPTLAGESAVGGAHRRARIIGRLQKTRLVPFGEYVPLRPLFGWITRHSKAAAEDRQRGTGPVVLRVDRFDIGPLISFETTFSDLPRHEAQLGAQLLVYQSSTSTYQGSWAQPQLASQVAVHAVEVGRPAVHAGLSGDSAAFDSRGRRLAWCPSGCRGVIVVSVRLGSNATLYQRLGDWVPVTAFAILGGAVGLAMFRWHHVAAR